jgi:hypothetical protein
MLAPVYLFTHPRRAGRQLCAVLITILFVVEYPSTDPGIDNPLITLSLQTWIIPLGAW